jgi:hypothetical protein
MGNVEISELIYKAEVFLYSLFFFTENIIIFKSLIHHGT